MSRVFPAMIVAATFLASGAGAAPMVELFTSQGCSSCPPADRFLGEYIADNPDSVALEFHVDYWDDLVHGRHGAWRDPYSDSRFADRQRRYHQAGLAGRAGVYTPQVVIGGTHAELGSAGARVRATVARLQAPLRVEVRAGDGVLSALIEGEHPEAAGVWLASFERMRETRVERGENHGKSLRNHHMVRSLRKVGEWRGEAMELALGGAASDGETGCAVFVQAPGQGAVLGAAYCP